ncbi:Fic family protein [bacterium]|nr:Fic family protein [bacterium]
MGAFEKKMQFSYENSQKIIKLVSEIDMFKGKWSALENKRESFLSELKNIATVESIGSSTRIEGATLTDQEIETLISNLDIMKLETRDKQEVVGYYESLELIFDNYNDIELTENYIKQLHSTLLNYSVKDDRQRGIYKISTNKVVATYPNGTTKIIFNTTKPHLVPKEMEEVIHWTLLNINQEYIHPLIVIGLFIYEFLSIHPFHDGNGRLSRLVTSLLLLKQEYDFIKYISFEHLIEERKKEYYSSLMDCQKNRYSDSEKIDNWIIFYLSSLKKLTAKLEVKLKEIQQENQIYLNDRQKQIVKIIKEEQPCKIGDIHRIIPGISINTLKKDINFLAKNQIILKYGQRKGSVYKLNIGV